MVAKTIYLCLYKHMAIIDIPKKEPERWAAIKMHLELKGYSFGKLAREHDINSNALSVVKNKSYPKSQKIIADKLELLPQMIWPERYGNDGQPIKHSPRYPRKDSKKAPQRQCVIKGR